MFNIFAFVIRLINCLEYKQFWSKTPPYSHLLIRQSTYKEEEAASLSLLQELTLHVSCIHHLLFANEKLMYANVKYLHANAELTYQVSTVYGKLVHIILVNCEHPIDTVCN